jgi:uncharacterized protein
MQATSIRFPMFHLAFPVGNIPETKRFYVEGLGGVAGRETAGSLIMEFWGHQLVAHVTHEPLGMPRSVYPRHFGLVFGTRSDWDALLQRAQAHQLAFYESPKQRFEGTPLEHWTFFLADPFGNLLEFKYYCHPSAIFGETHYRRIGDTQAS